MPCVYILLTRTDTLFARLLHGVGGNKYTHASLALDRDLVRMYSFARRYEPFMLPGGFIRENIHAGVFGRCGGADSLLLCVEDTGPGISPALRQTLFQRGVSTKGRSRGTGLALVQEVVEAYHGEIRVESENGVGTSFFLSFC